MTKCLSNKEEIKYEKIRAVDVLVFPAPTKKFLKAELDALQKYLEDGKHVFLMADEGGEDKLGSNFNFLLEKYNMLANGDTVIRTAYFKYFHPKEVFVQNGVTDEEFIRVANKEEKKAGMDKGKRLQLAFENDADDQADQGLGGYAFVYPFGCTLAVKAPAVSILTSGPISYPVNQPVCAYTKTKAGGVLLILGSYRWLCDDYIEKEENAKFVTFFENLITSQDFKPHVPDVKRKDDQPVTETLNSAPDISELAENLKPCLQDSEDLKRDPTKLYFKNLFSVNFDLVPEAIGLYKKLNVKYEPLTLIRPQFDTPMLGLVPAVFPPILGELPPPKLELFDLDDEFSDQKAKLANLTNKSTNANLDQYIRECAHILGVGSHVNSNDSRVILNHVLRQIVVS